MYKTMAFDKRSSELEHSFLKNRICTVEKSLHDVSSKLSSYNKNLSHLRDSADELAKSILRFASNEFLNQSLRMSVSEFSDIYTALQDYRNTQIQRIDAKVLREIANYDIVCKIAKDELKRKFETCNIEFKKQIQLDNTRAKNPTNWQKIAEKEAYLAREEATQASLKMSRSITSFERKKLVDIKHTLLKFIHIEMAFYAKAIELHTKAYNVIKNINVEEDLKEFQCHFKAYNGSLDIHCLSSCDSVRKADNLENSATCSHLTPVSCLKESKKSVFSIKNNELELGESSSSLKGESESKFDFSNQPLE